MNATFTRKLLLGATIASSVGIGYTIGAQPHMSETITILRSDARSLPRRRRTRAATANAHSA